MASFLRVRNLGKYQHYRDRNPPWVKLHRDLLEDYDFEQLPDATKAHAMLLLLLASRLENESPNDPEWIARKIGARSKVEVAKLLESRFLETCGAECSQLASDALASCDTSATVEGEKRERRGRVEKRERSLPLPSALASPEFEQAWKEWVAYRRESKFSPWKPVTVKAKLAELEPLGPAAAAAAIRRSIANGWKGIFPETGNGTPAKASRDCDRCGGKGYAEIPIPGGAVFDPELGRSRSTFSREPCKRCQGSGKF